jgi:hypothetical protein
MSLTLLIALIGAEPALRAEAKGAPPTMVFLKAKGGKLFQLETKPVAVAVEREVEVNVNGRIEKRKVIETKTEMRTAEEAVATDKASFFTAGGKKLNLEVALKEIGEGAIVIASTDGKEVDSEYLKAFKGDTLVLVSPGFVGGMRPPVIGRPALPMPLPGPIIRPLPPVDR